MKYIFNANDPKSLKHINEAYLEASDFAEAAKFLSKYLSDIDTKLCEHYQKECDKGSIGYDALLRVINTTCQWLEKEYTR